MQVIPPSWQNAKRNQEPLDESETGESKSWPKTQHSKNKDHSIWSHHFMANIWEKMEIVTDLIFLGSKITAGGDCSHEIKRNAYSLEEKLWQTKTAY